MKEFIERNKLLEEIEYFISHTDDEDPEHYAYKTCKRLIKNAITANVEEVVRCKYCKSWVRNYGFATFTPTGHCFYHDIDTLKHDFCSYGEKRAD